VIEKCLIFCFEKKPRLDHEKSRQKTTFYEASVFY
jgi:hypothetical protein